jgi:peroxiredoxin
MTQLVELQQALPKFEAAGIRLYAVSYDTPGELAAFAEAHDIGYTLLSDEGSEVIRSLGILNHFVTPDQVPYYGIPFPGTYIIDEQGVVAAKFFRRNLAQRDNAETMIDSALGDIMLGEEEPSADAGDESIRITAAYHGGGGVMKTAVIRHLVVRFELAEGLHIYGEPVPEGMVATSIRGEGPPGIHVEEAVAPATRPLHLPDLDIDLQVWDGRVDFSIPIWADDRIQGLVADTGRKEVKLAVHVRYQACDDRACRIPQNVVLELTVPVGIYVAHKLAGSLTATMTGMNTRRYMAAKVLRALRRSPVGGLRYLIASARALRRGPSGRR